MPATRPSWTDRASNVGAYTLSAVSKADDSATLDSASRVATATASPSPSRGLSRIERRRTSQSS
ncbi:MAG TPA: hypothetical protein VIV37_03670, partial [Gaiellaceae bacterium]